MKIVNIKGEIGIGLFFIIFIILMLLVFFFNVKTKEWWKELCRSSYRKVENLQSRGDKILMLVKFCRYIFCCSTNTYRYIRSHFPCILQQPCPVGAKSFRQLQCEEIDPDFSAYFTSGTQLLYKTGLIRGKIPCF